MSRSNWYLPCLAFLVFVFCTGIPSHGDAESIPLGSAPAFKGIRFGDTLPRVLKRLRADTDFRLQDCGSHWGLVYCRWTIEPVRFDITFEFLRKHRREHLCRVEIVGPSLPAGKFDELWQAFRFLLEDAFQRHGPPTQSHPFEPEVIPPASILWFRIWESPDPGHDRTVTLGLGRSESGAEWFPILWLQSNAFLRSSGVTPPGSRRVAFDHDLPDCF